MSSAAQVLLDHYRETMTLPEALARVQKFINIGRSGWADPELLAALEKVHEAAEADAPYRNALERLVETWDLYGTTEVNSCGDEAVHEPWLVGLAEVRALLPASGEGCEKCGQAADRGIHDTAETCEAVRGPCLDPFSHHPFRPRRREVGE